MVDVSFLSKKGIRREHAVVETCKRRGFFPRGSSETMEASAAEKTGR